MLAATFADGEVLIQFAASASAAQRSEVRGLVKGQMAEAIHTAAMRANGDGVLERVSLGKGMGVEQAVTALRNRPGVVFAEPNWKVSVGAVSNDPYYTTSGRLWGMYGDDSPAEIGRAHV